MLRGLGKDESLEILEGWKKAIKGGDLYGFGLSKMMHWRAPLARLRDDDFAFKGIFDNNSALWGQTVLGHRIINPAEIPDRLDGRAKLVILADAYDAIAPQLMEAGLREKYDFIFIKSFWTLLAFYRYDQLFLNRLVGVYVTDRCTLRCEYCGAHHPYYQGRGDRPLAAVKGDIDLFFRVVDEVNSFGFSNGESLLYPELPAALDHLADYCHRMANLSITSNGTFAPSRAVLDRVRRHRITYAISDYSGAGIPGYEEGLTRVMGALRSAGIEPKLTDGPWFDRFPSRELAARLAVSGEEGLRRHYAGCPHSCPATADAVYYYCAEIDAHLHRGLIPAGAREADGFDLRAVDPENHDDRLMVMMRFLGYHPGGHPQSCAICVGKYMNENPVPKARQLPPGPAPKRDFPCLKE